MLYSHNCRTSINCSYICIGGTNIRWKCKNKTLKDILLECPRTSFRDVLRVNVTERVWHSPILHWGWWTSGVVNVWVVNVLQSGASGRFGTNCQVLNYWKKKTIILDETSSQQEDLLVCLVLCLVVAIFLERTKRIGTDSECWVLRAYMTSHN